MAKRVNMNRLTFGDRNNEENDDGDTAYSISSDLSPDTGSDSSGTDSEGEDGDEGTEHDAERSSHHDERNGTGASRSGEKPWTVKKEEDQD